MMLSSKRPAATFQPDNGHVKRPRQAPSTACVNHIWLLNAEQSPLLKLPAELRNRIYEFAFGGHFIHVEAESKRETCEDTSFDEAHWTQFTGTTVSHLRQWHDRQCLHYYLCKAPTSEDDAYARSQDASLNEQLPGDEERLPNCWRLGDPHYIESCQKRHSVCCPRDEDQKPDWMRTPRERRQSVQNVDLHNILALDLLHASSQIYHEAEHLPFSTNTFSFRDVLALMLFLSKLSTIQASSIRTLHMLWALGRNDKRWNNWLAAPNLLRNVHGVHTLHVSLVVVQAGMGDSGPMRSDYYEHNLGRWMSIPKRFRDLPLDRVTVIVSDDPDSKFGAQGYIDRYLQYGWDGEFDKWLQIRHHQCLTVEEKRKWSKTIISYLRRESDNYAPE